mgnify:CR=1 FL=1
MVTNSHTLFQGGGERIVITLRYIITNTTFTLIGIYGVLIVIVITLR